ncbi:MAG: hypothetical protein QOE23_3473 [Pseudonocardiales bacterium]|jgi:hypothetical protein|nr:hypothetical protein [Pseudonocardiales bacterium]
MTDTDTDTQDARIRQLVNAAVDRELAGHRVAPPWQSSDAPRRSGHPIGRWSLPVLAASVAALLVAVTVLAIGHGRGVQPAPAAHSASPAPSASPSVSRSVNHDQQAAHRDYAAAVAGAVEATEAPGVSVGPVSAKDAVRFKNSGVISGGADIGTPVPGKTYSFTLGYLVGPSDEPPAVVTTEVRDVASGHCAQPFLARPNHAYQIQCQVSWLAGAVGRALLTARTPSGTSGASMNLTDPDRYPTSTAASASRAYQAAVAGAPEATRVAGVSDRPAVADEIQGGLAVGSNNPVALPDQGRSYPITLSFVPPPDRTPAVSVLTVRLTDVTAGRCPGAFRVRPGHAYQVSCQVTFRVGVVGKAAFDLRGPQGVQTTEIGISSP